jgi:endonuclease YncB( thermonuclease family)|tara:strand:- start:7095 stop:7538 length:444 start_codon:yes stop_codon:yes gene_type:complete
MVHNFKTFPELTNNQMELYYWESPHKQITEDFEAVVVKVVDGDTIRVKAEFRDFDFPVRMLNIDTPEKDEVGAKEGKDWLSERILNEDVQIKINRKQRVGKYGRLLGRIIQGGIDIGEQSIVMGHAKRFDNKDEAKIPDINKMFRGI